MNRTVRFVLLLCTWLCGLPVTDAICDEPPFRNSVVATDFDYIRSDDPTTAFEIVDLGRDRKEMPDKRSDELMVDDVFVLRLDYQDGTQVDVWASPEFKTRDVAKSYAAMVGSALGKLPAAPRRIVSHVVIHSGDEVAFAEESGHFFVLYSENIKKRIATHDLEETVFHETIHATLEAEHATNAEWTRAQQSDPGFITQYAASKPKQEDLPESALFAYTVIHHPGRLPDAVEATVNRVMPNRLKYLAGIFSQWTLGTPEPIAHWKLDDEGDVARDSAGSHHGQIMGAKPAPGRIDQAREFARTRGDHVEIGYSDDFALSTFTVSAWVYLTQEPTYSGVLGTRHGGNHTFDLKVNAAKVHGDIGDGKKWIETAVNFYAGDTGSNGEGGDLQVNRWYHIAYTVDADAGECRLYLDADLKKQIQFSGKPVLMTAANTMRIGHSSSTEFMDGRIDEVKIWNQALTTEQINRERNEVIDDE